MPRKVRELIRDLLDAGFYEIPGGGKGSHRKFSHARYPGAVTLSGSTATMRSIIRRSRSDRPLSASNMKASDQFLKWVEWSEEDQTYLGKCPDLISGIHGDDPIRLYAELCEVVDEVIEHFKEQGRTLPSPRTRPMQEVA